MNLIWGEAYSVGIKIIDEQHKKFVETVTMVLDGLDNQDIQQNVETVFARIGEYIFMHFATEETYFDEFQYEGAVEHKQKHQEFRETFEKIRQQYKDGVVQNDFVLIDFLEDWLVQHVLTMDKKYIECFHKHGLY